MEFSLCAANLDDCRDISRMIMELAEYEKLTEHVKVTQRDLEQDGFSKNPFFHGLIAEVPEQHKIKEGHTKIGYALYFHAYSSWSGRAIYMEDLYVMPEFRGKGVGKALMSSWVWLLVATSSTSPSWTGTNRRWTFTSGLLQYHCYHGLPLHALRGGGTKVSGSAFKQPS